MIDRPEEYEKMDLAESKLWWYKILHEQTLAVIQKNHKTKDIAILDAACGTGGLIDYLQCKGFQNINGFDLSEEAVLRSRHKTKVDIVQLKLQAAHLHYAAQSFDVVVCHDALYFVADDEFPKTLHNLWSLLKPGGQLILNLPAGNLFKGMHDRTVGIQERWSFSRFEKMLRLSGINYRSIDRRMWPFLLSPLILMIRLLQRFRLMIFSKTVIKSDVGLPPLVLNRLFYKLTNFETLLPFKRKFGSSIFLVIHR